MLKHYIILHDIIYTSQMHGIVGRGASGQCNVMQSSTHCMDLHCNENYMDNIASVICSHDEMVKY